MKVVKSGDDGGPLLVYYNKRYYLVGIISAYSAVFIERYNQDKYPALFTRMAAECEFLKSHTNFECFSTLIPPKASGEQKGTCGPSISSKGGEVLHPWYCRLYDKENNDFCGASLISRKHAITAAHCFKEMYRNKDILESIYMDCGLRHQRRKLRVIELHPQYKPGRVKNDIAILEANEDFAFDGATFPICIPKQGAVFNPRMIAVGVNHNYKKSLLEFFVHRIENNNCALRLVILQSELHHSKSKSLSKDARDYFGTLFRDFDRDKNIKYKYV